MTEPWTLILDDALANSFIAPSTDDINDDQQLICKFSNLDKELLPPYSFPIILMLYLFLCTIQQIWIVSAVEEYERSWEQNEELGLNDIDTSSADAAYNSTGVTSNENPQE